MAKYKVLIPVGKKEKGPGYRVGDVFQDGDLSEDAIRSHLAAKFIAVIPDKKKKEVKTNG
ncbi:hypothetical protein KC887_01195 [Candidatus Kaiserbacteria bacterium]|nr:hypothetical protein [Candidatus Kaiserbacteria bacterium]